MSISRVELDRFRCGKPDCQDRHGELFLHPICHPETAVDVCYFKRDGALELTCHACGRVIVVIQVARCSESMD